MSLSMSALFAAFIVRDSDGSCDIGATCAKFEDQLAVHLAERELEESTIADAVAAVFDQYKGGTINMPAVATFTLSKLNAQPENYQVLSDRVLEYVRSNSQGKTSEDGVQDRPDSLFVIAKGKHGGVKRRRDVPAKNAK